MKSGERRERVLAGAALLAAIALGLGLRGDSLQTGRFSDDFVEEAMLLGHYPVPRGPLDLFNFVDGSAREVRTLMDRGALPWWSAPDLQLAMFRPLTSALVGVDRALFGDDVFARHLHSALWWALGLCAALWLWRGTLAGAAAPCAVLLFALEEAHTLPLSWLANRGALVALASCTAALAVHVRAREAGRAQAWRGLPLLALGLLAGEWAFPFLGYFVAYEWLRGPGAAPVRLRALAPALSLGLAYLVARSALGYGTRSSGVYVDALGEPLEFVAALCQRLPVFFADLTLGVPAHQWDFGSPHFARWLSELERWRIAHAALGLAALVALAPLVRWLERSAPAPTRDHVRWLAVGAVLAQLPMVSSFPTSRLVLPGALGITALVAALLTTGAARLRPGGGASAWRVAAWVVLLVAIVRVHGVGAVIASRGDAAMTRYLAAEGERWMLDADLGADVTQRRVVQVAASEHTVALFTPLVRATRGKPMPRSFWTLSMADSPLRVHRPAADRLELTALSRPFVDTSVERLYREAESAFRAGDRVALDGLEVEVLEVAGAQPRRVAFTFERSLDDPLYRVVTCTREGVRPLQLPPVGATLELPYAGFPGIR